MSLKIHLAFPLKPNVSCSEDAKTFTNNPSLTWILPNIKRLFQSRLITSTYFLVIKFLLIKGFGAILGHFRKSKWKGEFFTKILGATGLNRWILEQGTIGVGVTIKIAMSMEEQHTLKSTVKRLNWISIFPPHSAVVSFKCLASSCQPRKLTQGNKRREVEAEGSMTHLCESFLLPLPQIQRDRRSAPGELMRSIDDIWWCPKCR